MGDLFYIEDKTSHITFDDVIGLADVKRKVSEIIEPLRHPEEAEHNLQPGALITLFGPYGTGKMSLARAIASELDADMIVPNIHYMYEAYVGNTEMNISELFKRIHESDRPTVLYFDDGEHFFGKVSPGEGYHLRILNEWKSHLYNLLSSKNAVVIIACKDPEIIDSEILSKSTSIIYVPLPDEEARKKMFEKKLEGVPIHNDIDFAELAEKTHLYCGRRITHICENAKRSRFRKVVEAKKTGKNIIDAVCQEDLLEAIIETRPETSEKDIKRYEAIAERIASGGKV